jgi:hypothetical protein
VFFIFVFVERGLVGVEEREEVSVREFESVSLGFSLYIRRDIVFSKH